MRRLLACACLTILVAGCVVVQPSHPPMPAVRVEQVPPPPTERVVWQPGEWHWTGDGYVWRPGHYVERLVVYHRFVPGHWDGNGRWEPGHWV